MSLFLNEGAAVVLAIASHGIQRKHASRFIGRQIASGSDRRDDAPKIPHIQHHASVHKPLAACIAKNRPELIEDEAGTVAAKPALALSER
jgi:hypothetical protein